MKTETFIEMNITVELDSYTVTGELKIRDFYFLEFDYESPNTAFQELAKAFKRCKMNARMITITIKKGVIESNSYEVFDELRWIPATGENQCKIAKCENKRFDFDNTEACEMSAVAFIRKYGRTYSKAALEYHKEYQVPVMGDFDKNGD